MNRAQRKLLTFNQCCRLKFYFQYRTFLLKYLTSQTALCPINACIPQGSVFVPLPYLFFTADLPTTGNATTATFLDDMEILTSHEKQQVASQLLQTNFNLIQIGLKKWRMQKANKTKLVHVTITNRSTNCLPSDRGIYLDKRMTWKKYLETIGI